MPGRARRTFAPRRPSAQAGGPPAMHVIFGPLVTEAEFVEGEKGFKFKVGVRACVLTCARVCVCVIVLR